ncbi:hypothetical protein [Desertihabitans brevis]|uniref:hypothetical protein n=1 Tax=Desertihabitans brevis TaxID=2268447 RepID=UPI0011BED823|nr:hypothetical protein [Desertihabitans brevis]
MQRVLWWTWIVLGVVWLGLLVLRWVDWQRGETLESYHWLPAVCGLVAVGCGLVGSGRALRDQRRQERAARRRQADETETAP